MHKAFFSEGFADKEASRIHTRPMAERSKAADLYLSDAKDPSIASREEGFLSRIATKIPGIKQSSRAYSTYLNRMRTDVFDSMVRDSEAAAGKGLTKEEDKAIANFVNIASGRGTLGRFEKVAGELGTVFFAPRLVASRFQVFDPRVYTAMPPEARKKAIKSMAATIGLVTTALATAKLAGAKVESDPRNSDFAKIRVGNTRVDLLAGEQQNMRYLAQFLTGEKKNEYGKVSKAPRGDTLLRFARSKFSPVAGAVADITTGKSFTGEKVTPASEAESLFAPMFLADIKETLGADGAKVFLPLGLYGAGVTTYGREGAGKSAMSNLGDEFSRINYTPGSPKTFLSIGGKKINLLSQEVQKLQEAQDAASKATERVIKDPTYLALPDNDEDPKFKMGQTTKQDVIEKIYRKYRARAVSEISPKAYKRASNASN